MRVFIDTSSLFKRYIQEHGSLELEPLFQQASEIIVSAVTWVEFNVALSRRSNNKVMTPAQVSWAISEAKKDFEFYSRVEWNENLEEKVIEIAQKFSLKTLDAIQLASGILSKADVFVTSDKKLFEEANKVIRGTRFI